MFYFYYVNIMLIILTRHTDCVMATLDLAYVMNEEVRSRPICSGNRYCSVNQNHCRNNAKCWVNTNCDIICECGTGFYGRLCQYKVSKTTKRQNTVSKLMTVLVLQSNTKTSLLTPNINHQFDKQKANKHNVKLKRQIQQNFKPEFLTSKLSKTFQIIGSDISTMLREWLKLKSRTSSKHAERNNANIDNGREGWRSSEDTPDNAKRRIARNTDQDPSYCPGVYNFHCSQHGTCYTHAWEWGGMTMTTHACRCHSGWTGQMCHSRSRVPVATTLNSGSGANVSSTLNPSSDATVPPTLNHRDGTTVSSTLNPTYRTPTTFSRLTSKPSHTSSRLTRKATPSTHGTPDMSQKRNHTTISPQSIYPLNAGSTHETTTQPMVNSSSPPSTTSLDVFPVGRFRPVEGKYTVRSRLFYKLHTKRSTKILPRHKKIQSDTFTSRNSRINYESHQSNSSMISRDNADDTISSNRSEDIRNDTDLYLKDDNILYEIATDNDTTPATSTDPTTSNVTAIYYDVMDNVTSDVFTTSLENTTQRRDVCDGVYHKIFNCHGRGRCFMETRENMSIPACECDDHWGGSMCHKPCTMKCLHGGLCYIHELRQHCVCRARYHGRLCEKRRPTVTTAAVRFNASDGPIRHPRSEELWKVGVAVGVSVLGVAVVVCAVVVMWWRRALVIRKLIYQLQPYEDDDNMEYDAFLSYKASTADFSSSPEERFVVDTLLPKLEREMGFRVCVHFRDFNVGYSISENVLHAVENSRRTVMLISRAYIADSMWCRFEYEQAQVAMQKQKQRIIPILYEDISDVEITDPILALIMRSITYVEKPPDMTDNTKVDQFWTRLWLSMPKKRAKTEGIELTWQESCDSTRTEVTTLSDVSSVGDKRLSTIVDSGIHVDDLVSNHISFDTYGDPTQNGPKPTPHPAEWTIDDLEAYGNVNDPLSDRKMVKIKCENSPKTLSENVDMDNVKKSKNAKVKYVKGDKSKQSKLNGIEIISMRPLNGVVKDVNAVGYAGNGIYVV